MQVSFFQSRGLASGGGVRWAAPPRLPARQSGPISNSSVEMRDWSEAGELRGRWQSPDLTRASPTEGSELAQNYTVLASVLMGRRGLRRRGRLVSWLHGFSFAQVRQSLSGIYMVSLCFC